MNTWEAIFSQSPVNKGFYNGEKLPQVHWDLAETHVVSSTVKSR